jgi:hypothetical protein
MSNHHEPCEVMPPAQHTASERDKLLRELQEMQKHIGSVPTNAMSIRQIAARVWAKRKRVGGSPQ